MLPAANAVKLLAASVVAKAIWESVRVSCIKTFLAVLRVFPRRMGIIAQTRMILICDDLR